MNVADLKQFKGLGLNTKTAEQYAIIRLGLNPNEWCAYAWSYCISKYDANEAYDAIDDILEDADKDGNAIWEVQNAVDASRQDMHGSDMLPNHQMYVKLVNAPSIEAARQVWNDKGQIDYKVCFVDWDLVQALAYVSSCLEK